MKSKVNSYIAILLITIAGSAASLLIVHVATANQLSPFASTGSNEASYSALQKSILKQ